MVSTLAVCVVSLTDTTHTSVDACFDECIHLDKTLIAVAPSRTIIKPHLEKMHVCMHVTECERLPLAVVMVCVCV